MLGHGHTHAVILAEDIEGGAQRPDAPLPGTHVERTSPVGGNLHVPGIDKRKPSEDTPPL